MSTALGNICFRANLIPGAQWMKSHSRDVRRGSFVKSHRIFTLGKPFTCREHGIDFLDIVGLFQHQTSPKEWSHTETQVWGSLSAWKKILSVVSTGKSPTTYTHLHSTRESILDKELHEFNGCVDILGLKQIFSRRQSTWSAVVMHSGSNVNMFSTSLFAL